MLNPLDARTKLLGHGSGYFQYYIKIVPTIYEPLRGEPLHTNQYSFNELFRTTKATTLPLSTATTTLLLFYYPTLPLSHYPSLPLSHSPTILLLNYSSIINSSTHPRIY